MHDKIIDMILDDLKELKKDVRDDFQIFDEKMDSMAQKIDLILRFKWQVIGGAVTMSFLITLGFQMLSFLFQK
jgi:hypothetical protein